MTSDRQGWTTASVEAVPRLDSGRDVTPGLVLVYSRLHEHLASAVPFDAPRKTIGREPRREATHLAIPEAAVSRDHAEVEKRADGWWISDRRSTNGTVVNGVRVTHKRLEDHDVVRIGDTLFRFASAGVIGHSAYRIDGSVVRAAGPVPHGVDSSTIVGGYQVQLLLEQIEKVARTELSVVVTGESGTGKELVAKELHRLGDRGDRQGPFQAINCAALPANLIESELFGYRKGAFTGAAQDKQGLIRAAHGGTLFLDEIGDMPLEAQAKLLRVLQEKEVLPLGATTPQRVDVRVVCATHRDLDSYVAQGKFRGDLLARLREYAVELPALRHRREDLFMLARHFLARAGQPNTRLTFPYMLALAHHDWPFNVRELESAVKLSLALADGGDLDLVHLPDTIQRSLEGHGNPAVGAGAEPMPPRPARAAPSEEELRNLLAQHKGNIAAVGRELGKERMQVHRWLKRFHIDVNDYRD